jgi:hypothetical protein
VMHHRTLNFLPKSKKKCVLRDWQSKGHRIKLNPRISKWIPTLLQNQCLKVFRIIASIQVL